MAIQTYLLAIIAGTSTLPATLLRLAGCVSCIPSSKLLSLQTYLLAVAQGQSTDPGTLMLAANCNCVPPGIEDAFRTYGLAALAGGSQDPETLAPLARCFMCFSPDQEDYIQTYLMGVWAGIDVSTIAGIEAALEASSAFTGLSDAVLESIGSYILFVETTQYEMAGWVCVDGLGVVNWTSTIDPFQWNIEIEVWDGSAWVFAGTDSVNGNLRSYDGIGVGCTDLLLRVRIRSYDGVNYGEWTEFDDSSEIFGP